MKRFLLFPYFVLLTFSATVPANAGTTAGIAVTLSSSSVADAAVLCPLGAFDLAHAPKDVPQSLRAQARPDQCFLAVHEDAVTETFDDKVVLTPAQTTHRTVPAVKTTKSVRVLVTPARSETIAVPAATRTVTEDVVIRPATTREEIVPAVYGVQTQKVMVKLPRTEWEVSKREFTSAPLITPHDYQPVQIYAGGKKLETESSTADANKGTAGVTENISPDYVYTLKQYPAEYEEQQVRVQLQPETVRRVAIPETTEKRSRVIVDMPAHQEVREIPAVYRDEIQDVILEPERTETVVTPPVETVVQKQRVVKPAGLRWTLVTSLPPVAPADEPDTGLHASSQIAKTADLVEGSSVPLARVPSVAPKAQPPAYTAALASPSIVEPSLSRTGKFQYKLGPGDKVRVLVFGEPDLTGEFIVSGDGRVSIPLIGEVTAIGLTSPELQENIRTALSPAYVQDARVNVEVLSFRPFYILGEVNKPGEYPFTNGLTVSKAVATASGYTYRANSKKVFIKRDGEDKETVFDTSASAVIGPGDVIRIPERYF